MIELANIRKKYSVIEVLKGINLTIGKGEFISVRGKSGVGKTTLLSQPADVLATVFQHNRLLQQVSMSEKVSKKICEYQRAKTL